MMANTKQKSAGNADNPQETKASVRVGNTSDEAEKNQSKVSKPKQKNETSKKSGKRDKDKTMKPQTNYSAPEFYDDKWFWLFAVTLIILTGIIIFLLVLVTRGSCRLCRGKRKDAEFAQEFL